MRFTWMDALTNWDLIHQDLDQQFGVCTFDRAFWASPWPVTRERVLGLITSPTPTRLQAALTP